MSLRKKLLIGIALLDIVLAAAIFSVTGIHNASVDTRDYIAQIRHVAEGVPPEEGLVQYREFKPFYGVVGGFIARVFSLSPENAILFLNLFFFIGLSYIFFFLLLELEFSDREAFVGVMWLMSGYPLLKYGLALGTDISGWFFAALTLFVAFIGFKRNSWVLLSTASLLGFAGLLCKETGVLGLGAAGMYALLQFGVWPTRLWLGRLLSLSLPFLVLYGFQSVVYAQSGTLSFWDWYLALRENIQGYRTWWYLLGIEAAAFHVVGLYALIGLIRAIASGDYRRRVWVSRYIPLFVVSLPMLLWPIFISRILYIQFLFFIPMGLSFIRRFSGLGFIALSLVPLAVSFILFAVGHGRSLFEALHIFP